MDPKNVKQEGLSQSQSQSQSQIKGEIKEVKEKIEGKSQEPIQLKRKQSTKKKEKEKGKVKEKVNKFGFTVDIEENALAKKFLKDRIRDKIGGRFDRILIYSEDSHWKELIGIRLFGKKLIEGSTNMFPSTHYGICAKIQIAPEIIQEVGQSCSIS